MTEQRYVTLKGGPLDGTALSMTGTTLRVNRAGGVLCDVYSVDSDGLTASYAGQQNIDSGDWVMVVPGLGGNATVSGLG